MFVSLDFVRFVLPVHIGTRDFSSIDITPGGADCKQVARMGFADHAPGWLIVVMVGETVEHYVAHGSVRYARSSGMPGQTFPADITPGPPPAVRKKK